ncbi:MAG: hypothetical protein KGK07_09740 [Chloroflexota bacterium]|nr:hypothetical protein [Chloroflexota bacterium]
MHTPAGPPLIRATSDGIEVVAAAYTWRWERASDEAVLADARARLVLAYPLQPCVEATGRDAPGPGRCVDARIDGARLRVAYGGVNRVDALRLTLRFEAAYIVVEEVAYAPPDDAAVARLASFARWRDGAPRPAGRADTCVIPGGRQDPEQAIFPTAGLEDVRFSVGCFGMDTGTYHQQWALPHYVVACFNAGAGGAPSGAACAGLGAVPDGNVIASVDRGAFSYEVNVRGDLWGHRRGPREIVFDWPLLIAVAGDWYSAALAYFEALDAEGLLPERKAAVPDAAFWPQYDTWGDQAARRCFLDRFDEEHLRAIYADFRRSGLRARLFVIDDKWEGVYGSLSHDEQRFPHFLSLLDEIRADGHEVGLWTAFPRCEDYRALGLGPESVLMTPGGAPYVVRERERSWYVFDPTDEAAAAHLASRARYLVETYHPALVKIDFGYEIPTPDVAGPHDPTAGGERLFARFLEVICGELKCADPRVAVLYYCLTPLFRDSIDQCGMDDLWMSRGAYDEGFARRALLASWCGAFGVVPYGSSGYDWKSAASIWLDTAVIGTPGVIAPLAGDEYGARLTPRLAALYNGVARISRRVSRYTVALFDAELRDPAAGPRARTWARVEDGRTTVIALRPGASGVARAAGLAEADCEAVVASLTDDDVREARAVGVVPFGAGSVRIARRDARRPRAVAHHLSGRPGPVGVRREAGAVVVDLAPGDGEDPVELIELSFG